MQAPLPAGSVERGESGDRYRPVCRMQPQWQPPSLQLQAPFSQPQGQLLHSVVVFGVLLFIVVSLF